MLGSVHGQAWELWFLPRPRVNPNVPDTHPLLVGLPIPVSSEVSAHVFFPQTWLFIGGGVLEIAWIEEPGGPQYIGLQRG